MGPKQGTGYLAPSLYPGLDVVWIIDVIRHLFRKFIIGVPLSFNPGPNSFSIFITTNLRIIPAKPSRKQKPKSAAVIGVLGIAMDPSSIKQQGPFDFFYRLDHDRILSFKNPKGEAEPE